MYLSQTPPWFSFLVHPRQPSDVEQLPGASLLRRYSKDEDEFLRKACTSPALVVGEVTLRGSSIRGEVIAAVRMPHAILSRDGVRAVVEAAQLAADRGAALIGLGGLTAPVTGGGSFLLPHLPSGVTVTNGNALTAAIAKENVVAAIGLGGVPDPIVAVLGATGSVGLAASHLLADEGLDLILIGRSEDLLNRRLGSLAPRARLSDDVTMVGKADVVLVLTSDPSARLRPEMMKPQAVVVDIAQPANVPRGEYEEFRRAGVTVAEGAVVRIPGYCCTQEFFLDGPEDTFACLAETYLMSTTGMRDHSVGLANPDFARTMASVATQYGVRARPLQLGVQHSSPQPDTQEE